MIVGTLCGMAVGFVLWYVLEYIYDRGMLKGVSISVDYREANGAYAVISPDGSCRLLYGRLLSPHETDELVRDGKSTLVTASLSGHLLQGLVMWEKTSGKRLTTLTIEEIIYRP